MPDRFEATVEAIVAGDAAALQRLLNEQPELVRARSRREHHATLSHDTAANGVEDDDRGADVNAFETTHGARPLGWAHYGTTQAAAERRAQYDEIIARLFSAGAGL
jgi:hypothetical protein